MKNVSLNLKSSVSAYYFFKVHLHHFSKIKSQKEVTKQKKSRVFLLFLLNDRRIRIPCGSGFGSGSATLLKWVRPVLRAGGGACQDEGDHAAVCHHENRVPHRQRGPRTVGFFLRPTMLGTVLRIRNVPGSWFSFIPDPLTKTTEEERKFLLSYLFYEPIDIESKYFLPKKLVRVPSVP